MALCHVASSALCRQRISVGHKQTTQVRQSILAINTAHDRENSVDRQKPDTTRTGTRGCAVPRAECMVPQLNTVIACTLVGSASEDYHSPGGARQAPYVPNDALHPVLFYFSYQYRVSQCVFGWASDSNRHRAGCSLDADWDSTSPFL